jgi:hypothetical protein
VILARLAMLCIAATALLAAFGGLGSDGQPAALRVGVAAVVGLLAPLFWIGTAPAPRTFAARAAPIVESLALAGLAALMMAALGRGHQNLIAVVWVCAVLWAVLLLTRSLAGLLQGLWLRLDDDPAAARWGADIGASAVLALLGSAPLWLGPAAERLSLRVDGAIDGVLAASPLTHLAVASGLDLLRQEWLYQNSNLASLPTDHPAPVHLVAFYGVACVIALALADAAPAAHATTTIDP